MVLRLVWLWRDTGARLMVRVRGAAEEKTPESTDLFTISHSQPQAKVPPDVWNLSAQGWARFQR